MHAIGLEYEKAVANGTLPSARVELPPVQQAAWRAMLDAWRAYCAHPTAETRRAYYEVAVPAWEAVT